MTPNRPVYGGQALIAGVMIRGAHAVTMAVRRPSGEIILRTDLLTSPVSRALRRVPLMRGVLVLGEMLVIGTRALLYSASVAAEDEEGGSELPAGAIWGTLAASLTLAVGLFFILPILLTRLVDPYLDSALWSNVTEGLVRLVVFLAYLSAINLMADIRRVFAYHGAEHMTVHAYEHDQPMTVEAVRQFSTAHPRCGTAFLLVVLVVAIAVFALLGDPPLAWRILSRILLLPVIAAISYEFIRWSGKHAEHPLVRLVVAPSLALQTLTTRPPDDSQIEVAIRAMEGALEADAREAGPAPA
mgnify:CR=1 FL=1